MPHPTDPVRPEDGVATYSHHIPGAPVDEPEPTGPAPAEGKYCYEAPRDVPTHTASENLAARDNIVPQD